MYDALRMHAPIAAERSRIIRDMAATGRIEKTVFISYRRATGAV